MRKSLEATAQTAAGGVALLVGLGGRLAALCSGTVMEAGLRGIAVPCIEDALARMAVVVPRIVLLPGTLPRDEIDAITNAARSVGAEVVELPHVVTLEHAAHAVARAIAMSEARAAEDGPPTVRSYARLEPTS